MSNTLFSYNNKKTLLHKIPALLKLVFTCVFCFFVFGNFFPKSSLSAEKLQSIKILISSCFAIFLWIISKSGFQAFFKLKLVVILGLIFTLFKGFSLKSPYFIDIQLAKEGLLYSYNFFITTFVALLLFETTTMLEIQNDLQKIPLLNKTYLPMVLAITISFFSEIFSTWEEIRLAAKARKKPNTKNSLKQKVKSLITQFSSLLSIMLQKAEIKRKALLSRQKSFKIT